jgi:hypothetical protein
MCCPRTRPHYLFCVSVNYHIRHLARRVLARAWRCLYFGCDKSCIHTLTNRASDQLGGGLNLHTVCAVFRNEVRIRSIRKYILHSNQKSHIIHALTYIVHFSGTIISSSPTSSSCFPRLHHYILLPTHPSHAFSTNSPTQEKTFFLTQ